MGIFAEWPDVAHIELYESLRELEGTGWHYLALEE